MIMTVKFVVNDYCLIWNLLFQVSVSNNIYRVKQKIWETYKTEYNETYRDKAAILRDGKDFIPNNDTVYNIILESNTYDRVKKLAEKYRLDIMKLWDKNKKETSYLFDKIVRMEIPEYTFFVVNKEFEIIDHSSDKSMMIGKTIDSKNPFNILFEINLDILMDHIKKYNPEGEMFKIAIIELAVLNEYATRLTGRSYYLSGNPELLSLKRWLYPYWLMYLGIPKEDFLSCMTRDKVAFDADKYAYEKELKKMNLEQFIDFCIRNKRYIIRDAKM